MSEREDRMVVKVKRVADVPIPRYAHKGDAGMDLYATEDVTLMPGESVNIGSGLKFQIPRGYVGYVYARSGLGNKGLVVKNGTGVIDSTYRGEVGLTLYNNNPTHFWKKLHDFIMCLTYGGRKCDPTGTISVKKGDRVAQIVFQRVEEAELVEVDELDATDRGEGGFGSTGA